MAVVQPAHVSTRLEYPITDGITCDIVHSDKRLRSSCGITIREPESFAYTSGPIVWETGGVSVANKGKGKAYEYDSLRVVDKDTTQMDDDHASHVCLPSTEINEAVNNHVTLDVGSMHASSVESPGSRRHTSPNYPGEYTFAVSYYVFFGYAYMFFY